ncbi:MAG: OmpA family protein [Acidobacteriota bacterium]
MREKSLGGKCVAVTVLCLMMLGSGVQTHAAQFGGLRDAARKAKEAMQKKKEAEAQAQREAESVKESGKKDAPAQEEPESSGEEAKSQKSQDGAGASDPASIKSFSKFDFVPGEKIVGFEDFMDGEIGDFPARWDTNAAGEIVTIEGKPGRWLKFTQAGVFAPELTPTLPDNFTLEFDLLTSTPFSGPAIRTSLALMDNPKQLISFHTADRYTFTAGPGASTSESRKEGTSASAASAETPQFADKGKHVHISVWRQKERVRVYFNDAKIWDVPKAMVPGATYNAIVFYVHSVEADSFYYLSNLRLAVGAPDTRNKLLTEGKWVTHGILFDVNSDRIKPESYGTLKSVATVLKENADLKVKIVGHTDSDGDDNKNLDLSKRRAASVKNVLTSEFQIDAGRMETDGKGESEPADKNDTAAGKANNRRVEFVKM